MTNDWISYDEWSDPYPEPFEIDGALVEMTCGACPEQYDVWLGETRIGYLRLRYGHFRAAYPDVGGEVVYKTDIPGEFTGVFSPEERKLHLPLAVKALLKRHHAA